MVRLRPQQARDFVRVLRALCRQDGRAASVCEELFVKDPRTLRKLLAMSGLSESIRVEPQDFLANQAFIPAIHATLPLLAQLLVELS